MLYPVTIDVLKQVSASSHPHHPTLLTTAVVPTGHTDHVSRIWKAKVILVLNSVDIFCTASLQEFVEAVI